MAKNKEFMPGDRVRWTTANGFRSGEIISIEYMVRVDRSGGIIRAEAGNLERIEPGE